MPSFETDSPSFFILSVFEPQPPVDTELSIARGLHADTTGPYVPDDIPITASERRRGRDDYTFSGIEPGAMPGQGGEEAADSTPPPSGGGGGNDGGDTPPPAAGDLPFEGSDPSREPGAPDITVSEAIQHARARQILTVVDRVASPFLGDKGFVEGEAGLFVPAERGDILTCLRAANPRPGEVFADLGSGDGRWVLTAAGAIGLKAYGYELDPAHHELAERALQALKTDSPLGETTASKVHFVQGDFFEADVSGVDIIAHYAGGFPSTDVDQRLEEKLAREGRDGARVILYGDGLDEHTVTKLEPVIPEIPGTVIPTAIYRVVRS